MTAVFVGIPVMDGKPHYATVDSLLAEQFLALQEGVHLLIEWEVGCSLIGDARNRLVKRFLATNCTDMVFVDADLSWPPGSILKLVKSRKEVIGGTYTVKQPNGKFHVHGKVEKVGKLYRVKGLPGGFIKMRRSAFGRMKTKSYQGIDGTGTRDFFPMGFHRGTYYGEDYGFCRLYREAGGEIWLDPSIALRHHDSMTAYHGKLVEWLNGNS